MFCIHAKSLRCVRPCHPVDHSLPGSSFYEILQARILEWVAMPSSRDLPNPGIESACTVLAGRFFTTSTTCETFFVLWNSVNHLEVICNLKVLCFFSSAPRFLTLITFCHIYCVSFKAKPHS